MHRASRIKPVMLVRAGNRNRLLNGFRGVKVVAMAVIQNISRNGLAHMPSVPWHNVRANVSIWMSRYRRLMPMVMQTIEEYTRCVFQSNLNNTQKTYFLSLNFLHIFC